MGVVFCSYCTNYKQNIPIQKSEFKIEKNTKIIANGQKISEMETYQKGIQIVNELNENKNDNNNNIIIINENNENLNENDEENSESSDQHNIYKDIDVVEERPEEEELSYTNGLRSTNNVKNKTKNIQKKCSDSFRRKSLQLYEYELNNKIKKFGDVFENDNIENYTNDKIKDIEKKLGLFQKNEKIINDNNHIKKSLIIFKENKILYQGYWSISGNKEGFGTCIDKDGNKYIGFWLKNLFHGKGRIISINGNYYEGNFLNGNIEGHGIFHNDNEKYTYIGNFKNNKYEGHGEIIYENSGENEISHYKGFFKNGLRDGKGKLEFSNGNYYDGEFKNNCFSGEGDFYFNDGRFYKGHWENNIIKGVGEFNWKNGDRYKGEYKNYEKEGYGEYYNDKNYYKGYWVSGFPHGKGKARIEGNTINGTFRFGKVVKLTGMNENLLNTMNTIDTRSNKENAEDSNANQKEKNNEIKENNKENNRKESHHKHKEKHGKKSNSKVK